MMSISKLSAWVIEPPVDHARMFRESDLVAIASVQSLGDTGIVKTLKKSGLKYREVGVQLKLLSVLKGKAEKEEKALVHRTPTKGDLMKDGLEEFQALRQELLAGVDESNHLFRVSLEKGDTVMVYLKKKDGSLRPVTGFHLESHSFFVMEKSNRIRSKNMLKALNDQRLQEFKEEEVKNKRSVRMKDDPGSMAELAKIIHDWTVRGKIEVVFPSGSWKWHGFHGIDAPTVEVFQSFSLKEKDWEAALGKWLNKNRKETPFLYFRLHPQQAAKTYFKVVHQLNDQGIKYRMIVDKKQKLGEVYLGIDDPSDIVEEPKKPRSVPNRQGVLKPPLPVR